MSRRRRRPKASGQSSGGFAILILSLILISQRAWLAIVGIWIFALVLWAAFFMKTQCDVETGRGEGCGNDAHGRLRACHLTKHKRAKRDALWQMFGLRNPAIRYRIMWAQQRSSYGRVFPQPEEAPEPRVTRPLYDGTMLAATVLSAVVAAMTFVVQFHLY